MLRVERLQHADGGEPRLERAFVPGRYRVDVVGPMIVGSASFEVGAGDTGEVEIAVRAATPEERR